MNRVIKIKPFSTAKRPENVVYIGRPFKWGNPFAIGRDGTREEVIAKYREWIKTQPDLLEALPELYGKILACHCKPLACHGDVLVELVDAWEKETYEICGDMLPYDGVDSEDSQ